MTRLRALPALTAALLAGACATTPAPPPAATPAPAPPASGRTMQQILDASTPADWRALDPAHTLLMELDDRRRIEARQAIG